ncbi:MAG: hypothetical protein IJM54_06730 [Thermoguttaceae bacterium]|nr:hypothetical protein [Thermoguttaceae bacterium]
MSPFRFSVRRSSPLANRLLQRVRIAFFAALPLFMLAPFVGARGAALASETDAPDAQAESENRESPWFRLVRDGKVPVALQTSIVRHSGSYVGKDGQARDVSVDLVGAIHLAEPEYYDALNEEFRNYETVVFELVAPKGSDVKQLFAEEENSEETKKGSDVSPLDFVSYSQIKMGEALGMIHQKDGIDYLADNFVRGDMDAEDFVLLLFTNGDVGEFFVDNFFSSFSSEGAGQLEGWGIVLLSAKNRRLALRRLFAVELSDSELNDIDKETKRLEKGEPDDDVDSAALQEASDEEREGVLIHLRNKKAIEAVKKELDAGKTKIAVFYGAAHLPDLNRRIEKDLGLTRDGEPRWFNAWNMKSEQ